MFKDALYQLAYPHAVSSGNAHQTRVGEKKVQVRVSCMELANSGMKFQFDLEICKWLGQVFSIWDSNGKCCSEFARVVLQFAALQYDHYLKNKSFSVKIAGSPAKYLCGEKNEDGNINWPESGQPKVLPPTCKKMLTKEVLSGLREEVVSSVKDLLAEFGVSAWFE